MTTLRQRITDVIAAPFPTAGLTDREAQAARLASRGLPLSAIRAAMGLPERTTYRTLDSALLKISDHLGRHVTRYDLPGLVLDRIEALVAPRPGGLP